MAAGSNRPVNRRVKNSRTIPTMTDPLHVWTGAVRKAGPTMDKVSLFANRAYTTPGN